MLHYAFCCIRPFWRKTSISIKSNGKIRKTIKQGTTELGFTHGPTQNWILSDPCKVFILSGGGGSVLPKFEVQVLHESPTQNRSQFVHEKFTFFFGGGGVLSYQVWSLSSYVKFSFPGWEIHHPTQIWSPNCLWEGGTGLNCPIQFGIISCPWEIFISGMSRRVSYPT